MRTVFRSGKIILKNEIVEHKCLIVEDGIISGIYDEIPENYDEIDA